MTIRFIKSWNGYYDGQVVTNPSGRIEAELIALGYAVSDLDGPDNSAQLAKLVTDSSGNTVGIADPISGGAMKVFGSIQRSLVVVGDSFAAYSNFPNAVSAITCASGVVTVTSASHGGYTGSKVSIVGAANMLANVHQATITVLSATQFTYLAPGLPDGAVATDGASIQAIMLHSQSDNGLAVNLQRLTGGAFNVVSNAGCPGRTSTQVLQYWAQRVSPFNPDAIYWDCYYNDVNQGVATATTLANVQTAIGLARGAFMMVSSAWPFGSGAAANTAANLQKMVNYNRQLEALCAQYKNVLYVDNYTANVSPTTGLIANTNNLFADGIHPSWTGRYLATKALVPQIAAYYKPRSLVASGIDNVATDATNPNIARFMPKDATLGGGVGTGVTASVATTDGVTGSAAAGTAGAANGFTVSGTNITTGVAWVKTGTDGFPYQAAQFTAFSAAGGGRITVTLTNSDLTPGGNVSISFKGSIATKAAASNKSPAGQQIAGIFAQFVITIDGSTYTAYEAKPSTTLVANSQTEDLVDFTFVMDNVPIPTGSSITLARVDLLANTTLTTANFQMDMGRVRVIKNS